MSVTAADPRFFGGWNPPSPTETADHAQHWPPTPLSPFDHPDCWFCRWDAAHEHHTGGPRYNPLCPKCNPEAPKP